MRFIIMHKTNAHWEAGAIPTPRVDWPCGCACSASCEGRMHFARAEGLRPSSEGVRLRFSSGRAECHQGSVRRRQRVAGRFQHRSHARRSTKQSSGLRARPQCSATARSTSVPSPSRGTSAWIASLPAITTRRYMVLRKATAATEAEMRAVIGTARRAVAAVEETTRTDVHLATETMRPSAGAGATRTRRNGVSVVDGPFTESKELIGGYVVVSAESLDDAGAMGGAVHRCGSGRRSRPPRVGMMTGHGRASPVSIAACFASSTNAVCAAMICQRPSRLIQTFVVRYRRWTSTFGPVNFTTNR